MAMGTVTKTKSGAWLIRFDGPRHPDGRRNQIQKTVRGTKRNAEATLASLLVDLAKPPAQRASETPVSECCQLFIKDRADKPLRPATIDKYRTFFKRYLLPVCGEMPVSGVDQDVVQQVIDGMVDRGLAASSIHTHHTNMKGFFTWAVKTKHYLPETPVHDLSLPEVPQKSAIQILSPSEIVDLLSALEGTAIWLPTFLGIHTGMRVGEVLGLSWDDVDLVDGTLSVRHTFCPSRDGYFRLGPPKTKSSWRTISLSAEVVKVLREWKEPEEYLYTTRVEVDGKQVFASAPVDFRQVCAGKDGQILTDELWRTAFQATLRREGLRRIKLHDLRHTHASLLLLDGESMLAVSRRLGHANIQTTINLYGHLLPNTDSDVASRFSRILGKAA